MLKIKGLTFLEVMIALFLFTIVLTGFAQRAWVALDANRRSTDEIIATNLRKALMAEIMSKKFADPDGGTYIGPDPGASSPFETRFNTILADRFDDVDDYNETGQPTPVAPVAISGLPLNGAAGTPDYSGYRWNVTVINGYNQCQPTHTGVGCDVFNTSASQISWDDCKEVRVTVTTPGGRAINETEWKINNPP